MPQERLPKQNLLAKANGEDQFYDLELDGPITLTILNGIASDTVSEVLKTWYYSGYSFWQAGQLRGWGLYPHPDYAPRYRYAASLKCVM